MKKKLLLHLLVFHRFGIDAGYSCAYTNNNYYYYHEIVHRVHKNNTKIKKLKKVKKKANVLTPIIAHTANNFINV